MSRRTGVLLAAAFSSLVSAAHADDAAFLASFEGSWSGKGRFRISTTSSPMPVSCSFEAATSATSLSLDGKCRGMVVVSRRIAVMLNTDGGAVSGAYVGSTTGPAGLSGARQGDAFDLSIRWAKPVNGDQEANMKVEKVGDDGMKLVTTDVNPNTGKGVVTGEIVLSRL
jgi:hypothetical protein